MKNLADTIGNFAIQAELIGPAVQGNLYELEDYDIRIFNVYFIDQARPGSLTELKEISQQLGLTTVPILDENYILQDNISTLVKLSIDKSQVNPKKLREGIVIRNLSGNFSCKAINPEYLLKQE
jgi:ATP-dependent RNA circularization protein (DNA/RNA ligase family)